MDAKAMDFCQSCGMPLSDPADRGTEQDGSQSQDYCKYCYENGAFTSQSTLEEMIEGCVQFVVPNPYPDADAARKAMWEFMPQLKRWKN